MMKLLSIEIRKIQDTSYVKYNHSDFLQNLSVLATEISKKTLSYSDNLIKLKLDYGMHDNFLDKGK